MATEVTRQRCPAGTDTWLLSACERPRPSHPFSAPRCGHRSAACGPPGHHATFPRPCSKMVRFARLVERRVLLESVWTWATLRFFSPDSGSVPPGRPTTQRFSPGDFIDRGIAVERCGMHPRMSHLHADITVASPHAAPRRAPESGSSPASLSRGGGGGGTGSGLRNGSFWRMDGEDHQDPRVHPGCTAERRKERIAER